MRSRCRGAISRASDVRPVVKIRTALARNGIAARRIIRFAEPPWPTPQRCC